MTITGETKLPATRHEPGDHIITRGHAADRLAEPMSLDTMRVLAESIAKSRLFGIQTADQALVLMSIAQAEGRHPALAARDYHIIQGAPAKKAEAMLRDFLTAGGRVEWHELTDDAADATFSHPQGGSARIRWDAARVKQAEITSPMHRKYPRQMLRSRTVSEGVRTVWPMATSGMYVPEEIRDIGPEPSEPMDITPKADLDQFAAEPSETVDPTTGEITSEARMHPEAPAEKPPERPRRRAAGTDDDLMRRMGE